KLDQGERLDSIDTLSAQSLSKGCVLSTRIENHTFRLSLFDVIHVRLLILRTDINGNGIDIIMDMLRRLDSYSRHFANLTSYIDNRITFARQFICYQIRVPSVISTCSYY